MQRFWREPFSTASHLAGFILSLALLPILLLTAGGRIAPTVGALAFGIGLALVYAASTLCHGIVADRPWLHRLEKLDHAAIFLLIFGTYAPVCLVTLAGPVGWGILTAEGLLAVVGIILVLLRRDGTGRQNRVQEGVRVALYLVMGWLVVPAMGPLVHALAPGAVWWLIGGGIAYSVGAVVFVTDWPHLRPGKFSAHDLWHLFVLAGSSLHCAFVLGHVLPHHGA